ncbi:TonB-dependent receptor [Sphaerotilus uruguayifluvii]|uniref:Outer membrane receptor protein involved in Fe transport n=1 Tax=Sphaerotilus uruguayifluvii TaxID=2735897 RepID=A0ABX2FYE5_9BURK|nr:TonB-dependent receptor [Leptothrix sp. C29]NRT55039.1 outer membrane receptor protein involved in Fe transport [Leptothrix sp. C29]
MRRPRHASHTGDGPRSPRRGRRTALTGTLLVLGGLGAAGNADAEPLETEAADVPFSVFVESTSLQQLAEMIVTDAKREQMSSRVTQHYLVLKQEALQAVALENGNLSELMRYTSGQFVNVLSREYPNWGSHGGLGARYNSYLLDGVPIDSMVLAAVLSPDAFERIEVQKGPASVLYSSYLSQDFLGSQTPLAGTTNLVLKRPGGPPSARFTLGAGSYGTLRAGAFGQGRIGSLEGMIGVDQERSDAPRTGDPGSWLDTVGSAGYRKGRLFLNLRQAFGRADHAVSLFWQHSDDDGNQGRPFRDLQHRYDMLNLSYRNTFAPDWDLQFKLGRRDAVRTFQNDAYPDSLALVNVERTRQRVDLADLSFSHRHLGESLLTLGLDRQQVAYDTRLSSPAGFSSPQNEAESAETALFVQEKLQLEHWTLRAGVRHNRISSQHHLLGGQKPQYEQARWQRNLWSLGLRHDAGQGLGVYANAGSSFSTPTAKQVGGTVAAGAALSGQIGNPALKPESGIGSDVGLDWAISRDLTLDVRLFLNRVRNMIVTNVVSTLPSQVGSVNAGQASARGLELDLRQRISAATQLFSNMTLIRTRVSQPDDPDQDGAQIPFVPRLIVNAGVRTLLGERLQLSMHAQWIDRYHDSSSLGTRQTYGRFATIGARLQMPLATEGSLDGARLTLDLNNLTDRRYAMPFSFRNPGFSAFLGLESRL